MSGGVEYTILEDKIHVFKWYINDHATIDKFVVMITSIVNDMPEKSTMYILHDYTETGVPPVATMARAMKRITYPPGLNGKIAHLYSNYGHKMVIKNAALITSFNPVNRRFFRQDEKEKAIQWLLSE